MKTYYAYGALLALLIFGCSKSDEISGGGENQKSVDADYALLLSKGSTLSTQLLNANGEVVTLNPEESTLGDNPMPQLTSTDGTKFLQYHKEGSCGGKIIQHDFSSDTNNEVILFDDLNDCDLTANAITFSDSSVFIAYEIEVTDATNEFKIRVVDMNSSDFSFVDVTLDKKPVDLTIANDRLFIMTWDEEFSEENKLSVMDLNTNTLVIEMNLGFDANRIFTDVDDNIIVSYDQLHSTLNSANMSLVYTNYGKGTEPKFATSTSRHFDEEGKLYYPIDPEEISEYPMVPAVYDFSNELMIVYAYENFLTEAKRNLEFEIETTTTVSYDEENNLMLIGYKKIGKSEGGLLRIKPTPEPAFIDNINLDGVPYEIFVN